ncbi:MAG: AAA family ATPase [Bacteroidales bacterium]|nr:AAA family ATPase [Bacteroidales bacterium]
MKVVKHKEYIDLLHACRNLILTGAPGTGKTYLAKMIAEEMEAETEFVQFHPSYDYTDFVEGLRPTDSSSFERRDGIFKEFCKRAFKNLIDSAKTQEVLEKEKNLDEKIDTFLTDAVENIKEFTLISGNRFTVYEYNDKVIRVESKDNEKTPRIDIKISEVYELLDKGVVLNNVHDIRDYFGRKFGTQQDSYTFVIASAIRAMKSTASSSVSKVNRKDYVFIIDEINRGEMSKILGELFFSIDPGYRGEKGRVKTQYQNLIEEADVFSKGFFIPENVYIIGTMNDIDRSVESMDFAVRRRFTWKEVQPKDRLDMWEDCVGTWKDEAQQRMEKVNAVISNGTVGLTREYCIGPAYFRALDNYNGDFSKLWTLHLEPLVKEYLRGSRNLTENLEIIKKAYELIDEPEQGHIDF